MRFSKSLITFIIALLLVIYFFYSSQINTKNYSLELSSINISNLLIVLLLLISSSIVNSLKKKKITSVDDTDKYYIYSEKKSSLLSIVLSVTMILSLITLIVGFLLLREDNPKIVFFTSILFLLSIIYSAISTDLIRELGLAPPLPNPKSKDYQQKLFMSYDEGQKHLMLRTLYKLYYKIQFGLVLLIFLLMFYSIFTDKSQVLGIIGIGVILIYMQISFGRGTQLDD